MDWKIYYIHKSLLNSHFAGALCITLAVLCFSNVSTSFFALDALMMIPNA